MPLVSVIVPVYKVEAYLPKCLDSIINQTLTDIEIICVNDGSPDNSQKILEEYAQKDARIKIITQKNQGLAGARNTGTAAATGEYVGYVDSDDWIEPETYAAAVGHMSAEVDLVGWGAKIICDNDDNPYKAKAERYHSIKLTGLLKGGLETGQSLPITMWNKLFRNSIIKQYNISSPVGLLYEDGWFFWKYMTRVKNIFYMDAYYYNYVLRGGSIMANKHATSNRMDRILGIYDVFCYYKNNFTLQGYKDFFADYFYRMVRQEYAHFPDAEKRALLEKSAGFANEMELAGGKYASQLNLLRNGRFNKLKIVKADNPPLWKRLLGSR